MADDLAILHLELFQIHEFLIIRITAHPCVQQFAWRKLWVGAQNALYVSREGVGRVVTVKGQRVPEHKDAEALLRTLDRVATQAIGVYVVEPRPQAIT